jgi:hypothetical protein
LDELVHQFGITERPERCAEEREGEREVVLIVSADQRLVTKSEGAREREVEVLVGDHDH